MARQTRTSSHPLTPTKWLKKFLPFGVEENVFARMGLMGTSDDEQTNMIIVHKDLTVTKGNKIRIPMTGPLTGVGGGNNFNSKDIAEAYSAYYFDVAIAERGNTTILDGPVDAQNMIEDWPSEATKKLGGWVGLTDELESIKALCGLYNLSTDVASVNENAPSTSRIAYGGETAAGVICTDSAFGDGTLIGTAASTPTINDALLSAKTATDNLMGPNFLEQVVLNFMASEPRPRLLTIEGVQCLLLIMTPRQRVAFEHNTTYTTRNLYAQVRGSKNPLLNTSMGFWPCGETMVLLQSYGRMESRTGAGGTTPSEGFLLNTARTATSDAVATGKTVGRALLAGAGAGAIAYGDVGGGQIIKRLNGDVDYGTGRMPLKGVDMMKGVSKTVFKNAAGTAQPDYACMVIDTCQN